jgi:DNA repair protein SbcD/Mre11
MKILHTSDWHLGKQLKKVEFHEDMELFFNWLLDLIEKESIDVLLMSGDLFDQSNPSQTAIKQYYQFLKRMIELPQTCKIIITGGNHDAPAVLDAPKELLNMLDIAVVGGVPEDVSELFVKVEMESGKLVVAAVPFLRDRDIRKVAPGESYSDKVALVKDAMKHYYHTVESHYHKCYSGFPYIVMGHLFVSGSEVSDSERDIQVGNQAGVGASIFGQAPHYVALGHIHKPQTAGAAHIRYSGSPIPLSFSEKNDAKQVVLLEWNGREFQQQILHVPTFRKLITLKGTLDEVQEKAIAHVSTGPLPDLLELQVYEDQESVVTTRRLLDFSANSGMENALVVQYKLAFKNSMQATGAILDATDSITRYSPMEIFKKRLEEEPTLENREALIEAFSEIVESLDI